MSITITSTPAQANHAAFNPVEYSVTTTRWDTEAAKSVSSIANSGGKVKATTSTAHSLEGNDIVVITGFTGLTQLFSRITVVDADEVILQDIPYVAYTLSGATITKYINNLYIKAQVKVGGVVIAAKYNKAPSILGVFTFDFSGVLGDYINMSNAGVDSSDTTVQAIVSGATNASVQYTITFSEYYDEAFGVSYLGSTASQTVIGGAVMVAHNFAVQSGGTFTDYILGTASKKLLTNLKTRYLRPGEKHTFQFITTESNVRLRIVRYVGGTGTATIGGNVAISNNRGTVTIDSAVFTTGVTMAEVTILNTSNTAISETLTYYPDSSSVRTTSRVQFKNLLGGCDSLYFNDNIQNLEAQSSAIRTTGSWNTYFVDNDNVYTLEMNANNTMLAWLEELKLSKVVYFNSVRCKIVDGNMVVQSRDFTTFVLTLKAGRKLLN